MMDGVRGQRVHRTQTDERGERERTKVDCDQVVEGRQAANVFEAILADVQHLEAGPR